MEEFTTCEPVSPRHRVKDSTTINAYPIDTGCNRTIEEGIRFETFRDIVIVLELVAVIELVHVDQGNASIRQAISDLTVSKKGGRFLKM